jgi:hypothetical protein
MHTHKRLLAIFFIFLISNVGVVSAVEPDKMKPEEVVAKHLAAIGSPEALAASKSRVVLGNAKAISRSNAVRDIAGVAQLASEGEKVVFAMIFNSTSYPYEKAGYDGQKMTVALWETSGQRSALAEFLMSQETIFKQGLIGGVLSSAWPLLNIEAKSPKLSYAGMKKVNERQTHELKYSPRKGGGNIQISLFFDAETFQHVRTEYQYQVSARMGARPGGLSTKPPELGPAPTTDTGSLTMNRYKLVEEFSDFKKEGDLTLPHAYKLRLTVDAQSPLLLEWVVNFTQFSFNQPIDASAFNVSVSKSASN